MGLDKPLKEIFAMSQEDRHAYWESLPPEEKDFLWRRTLAYESRKERNRKIRRIAIRTALYLTPVLILELLGRIYLYDFLREVLVNG
jgi:hypothetical protein